MTNVRIIRNDPRLAGQIAVRPVSFGDYRRFSVFAVHTRFAAIEWMVKDAELLDEITEGPAVIRQGPTREEVMAGLI
jgi:hypothetical protein